MILNWIVFSIYILALSVLLLYSLHGFVMLFYRHKYKKVFPQKFKKINFTDPVTIQLPLYNELYVAERLINAVCNFNYPKELLEIQVLDDSTDETSQLVQKIVEQKVNQGIDIKYIHRTDRTGFKAGALANGLKSAKGKFIAIFDADFIPKTNFLETTLSYFTSPKIAMVQKRWTHLNEYYSILTRIQAFVLNGHFVIEQNVRFKSGFFFNFNGTGGIWLKEAIVNAGGWQSDTITEDLDLSYRAQIKGWKFIYLVDETAPSELPIEMNALKAQQYRWTKGAIETAKKILSKLWKSPIPLRIKLQGTFHLTNNIVFIAVLIVGILNLPLAFVKNYQPFNFFAQYFGIFIIAFISTFLLYFFAQKDESKNYFSKLFLFPIFMAGSMGLSLNHTKAIFEGLKNIKSPFIRTPKFKILSKGDSFVENKYLNELKVTPIVIGEIFLSLYCLAGIIISFSFGDYLSIPFQFLFFIGFGMVGILSLKNSFVKRFNKDVRKQKKQCK